MNYFRLVDDGHESHDPLCVVPADGEHLGADLYHQYFLGAYLAADNELGRVAFFLARHAIEIGLKMLLESTPGDWPKSHDLSDLTNALPVTDPLRVGQDESDNRFREVVGTFNDLDAKGTGGRYPSEGGTETLSGICCIEITEFLEILDEADAYLKSRVPDLALRSDG